MEHSARQEVAKLRKMYEKMESVALTEIQDVSARLIGILLETKEKVQTKLSLDYESQMEIDHLVGNAVASVKKKEFKFAPSRDFLSCLKLGTLQQATRPNKHRRHPMNPRARSQSPCLAYRDRTHGHHRHRSSSSSSSSHSSGFIQIEWANGRSIETSNAYKAVHREGIEKQLFIDAIDGLVCCQSEVCTCAISLKRTESDLSSYSGTASSFASSTEQTSIDLNDTVVTLDLKEIESNMFWPQFCAVDRDTIAIFIYDVYSSSIRKYMISNGECIWTIAVENGEIDNMIVCGERLYISQNEKNRIQSFKQETGKIDQYFSLTENVRFPFGLACNHNQNTILVTAYNYNGSKVFDKEGKCRIDRLMDRLSCMQTSKEVTTRTILEWMEDD
ncbi:uncharacterized protein LOC123547929 [Mercenaria mercenaria]|uniref:uncharacterized protein LOC123547929 n=1 Tax=Mercenaria mercenaria TaxID=6596 RepID=UPI00234E61B2|nr:uncharacterized protein LOC123547929 [Mercenaria mercenaria]